MKRRLLVAVVVAAVSFGLGLFLAARLASWFGGETVTQTVITDPAKMEKARVDPTPGLLERVQLGRVEPTQVRIASAPSAAGQKRVADYCTPVPVGELVQTSANMGARALLSPPKEPGRRSLPDFGGRVHGSKVSLQSTLNDGSPWAADYKVRGRWTFVSDGDSVGVRSERFWSRLIRGLARCGIIAGVGAGAGYGIDALTPGGVPLRGAARGAAIAGGTCAALEIAF